MDQATRLEKNRSGYYEIRWTEPVVGGAPGARRTRSVSTRTTDRRLAETVRRTFEQTEREETLRAAGGLSTGALLDGYDAAAERRGVGITQRGCVRRLKAFFADVSPDDVTPEMVLEYGAERNVASGTLRRELNVLASVFAWAVKHRKLDRAPEIDLPPEGAARAVFLTELVEQELYALAAADKGPDGRRSRVGRFICLGLDTGARKSAILGLTWDRVDLSHGTVDFRDPTQRVTKKRRVATPIPDRLMPVLEQAWAERTGNGAYVLDDNHRLRAEWERFMAAHGYDGVTPHVLRHTRITLLLRAGVSVWDVSALVGASPDVITKVYGHHVADSRLRLQANRRAG